MDNQNNNENKTNDINAMINDLPNSVLNNTEIKKEESTVNNVDDSNDIQENVKQPVQETPVQETPVQETPAQETPTTDIPKFNSTETTLGSLKPDKQKSPIAMIVLFVFLMLFIIFMPQIITYVNSVLGTNLNANNGVSQNNTSTDTNKDTTDTDEEDVDNTTTIYNIDSTTTIKTDDLTITNLVKSNTGTDYNLSFTLNNNTTNAYTFTKKLYLEFYDDNNTFISRSLVNNSESLNANTSVNLMVTISSETSSKATKVEVVLRTSDDYPAISLVNNSLVCKNTTNTITYTFDKDALVKILDVYTYTKNSDATTYNTDLLTNRSRISQMDNLNGVDAVLTENTTGFISSTSIDYSLVKYSELTYTTNYFAENTLSKVVSFEASASGFTCS